MYRLTDYGAMVRDRRRVDAYRRALAAAVRPGSVVLDLGAGLGTFSVLACQLGAARVYAIESSGVITVSEEVARANGVADRIRFFHAPSTAVQLPERVDVIVSDLGGALPLFEDHLPSLIDARERFLAPGGVLIPERSQLFCAPVSNPELYANIVAPWRSVEGVDLGPAESMALHAPHAMVVTPADLAGEPRVWGEIESATVTSPDVSGAASWTIDRPVHAIALWFESTLHGDIRVASGPWSEGSVHATMVLPLLEPLEGRELHLTIGSTLTTGRYVTTWYARTDHHPGTSQSTLTAELHPHTPTDTRIIARRIAKELLLFDTTTGVYHVLNETGARVWELLQRNGSADTIANEIAAEFDVEVAQASQDVARVLGALREAGLLGQDE